MWYVYVVESIQKILKVWDPIIHSNVDEGGDNILHETSWSHRSCVRSRSRRQRMKGKGWEQPIHYRVTINDANALHVAKKLKDSEFSNYR